MKDTVHRTLVYHSVSCVCADCLKLDVGIKYFHPVLDTIIIPESDSKGLNEPSHTTNTNHRLNASERVPGLDEGAPQMKDGRTHKASAYEAGQDELAGIPNEVRRDRERLRRMLHAREADDLGLPDWMANAQMDRAREDGTVAFPPPRTESGPGLDYLGRPTRRRRVN